MKEQTKHQIRSLGRRTTWRLQEWINRPTSQWRMLPDYLIVGAQRCGTTSLQDLLARHPQVNPPALRKGIHYFDTDYNRGSKWYRSHFPLAANSSATITGEASPYYLFHPAVPARVREVIPEVKIIALLRDPVERAISHHKHEVRRGFETLPLMEALACEEERLAGELERLMTDPGYNSYNHQHFSYVGRGLYAEQIERYLELFGSNNVLILEAERLWSDPDPTANEVFAFLQIEPWHLAEAPHMNATKPGVIPAEIRSSLVAEFTPTNRRLEEMLGRSFSWT